MKIGLLARADNTGLGNLTYEFYRHMKPAKTWVIDISDLNGNKQYPERYPDAWRTTQGFPKQQEMREFLSGLDLVFTAEIPYGYQLFEIAKELGVKTVLQYMWEFLDYLARPNLPQPSLFAAASPWNWGELNYPNKMLLPVPIARDVLPFERKTQFKRFLHIVGKPAAHDRNGTNTVIEAAKLIKSDAEIVIRTQQKIDVAPNISVINEDLENYYDGYNGDVLLMPRRYGGLCLPVQEALSKGMPVLMGDNSPYADWLPSQWLLPTKKIGEFMTRTMVDIYETDPQALADKIDEMAGFDKNAAMFDSIQADHIAQKYSWKAMLPVYNETFKKLCSQP